MVVRYRRLAIVAATFLLILAGLLWYLHGRASRAEQLLAADQFEEARQELRLYLRVFRNDDNALLKLAESYARDPELPPDQSAQIAVKMLEKVDRNSPYAAKARLQAGRLRFLILNQPCGAEADFRASLAHDPDSFEANLMMWKLLDLTRRYQLVEPYFAKCFEAATSREAEGLLRDWYYSQFSTYVAASELDFEMGLNGQGKLTDAVTEYVRLTRFVENEETCALNHALLASWCEEQHLETEKWERFQAAWERVDEHADPFVFAVLFDILLEAGRFEEAEEVFLAWPEPLEGYDYNLRKVSYLIEIKDSPEQALAACRTAVATWPGTINWQLFHRLSTLLARLNKVEEAKQYQLESIRLRDLMDINFHAKLRQLLFSGNREELSATMSKFYSDIGRPVEAQAWSELAKTGSARQESSPSLKSSEFRF